MKLIRPAAHPWHWQHKMKIRKRRIETGLKMTSKAGILVFTIFGVAIYLLTFLGIALTTTEAIATWKMPVGSIGGAVFSGMLIISGLRVGRYLIMKLSKSNADIQ